MNVNVYIDGFNLYYGAIKHSHFHWLDIQKLAENLLPKTHQINTIKYFTARVKARPHDPYQPDRQKMYLRALGTLPKVSIIYGSFLSSTVRMPLANPQNEITDVEVMLPNGTTTMLPLATPIPAVNSVEVLKSEEKGSDVNIGAHLLHDAHLGAFDLGVVISNDSDLVEPIRLVVQEFQRPVWVFNPHYRRGSFPSRSLKAVASHIQNFDVTHLQASLFPDTLTDAKGTFNKPPSW